MEESNGGLERDGLAHVLSMYILAIICSIAAQDIGVSLKLTPKITTLLTTEAFSGSVTWLYAVLK